MWRSEVNICKTGQQIQWTFRDNEAMKKLHGETNDVQRVWGGRREALNKKIEQTDELNRWT
jgi:hypothetical protein